MRMVEVPMVLMSLLGSCLLSSFDSQPVHADFAFGAATNLGPVVNSSGNETVGILSPDGLELYFNANRPGGYGGYDIWLTKRTGPEGTWGTPINPGPQINSASMDAPGNMSADGLTLYFNSTGEYGGADLYLATRATRDTPWGPRVNLGPSVNGSWEDWAPFISPDGLELFFMSNRPGQGGFDIWVSKRATTSAPWGPPVSLGPTVNSPSDDICGGMSSDGLAFFLVSNRPGGYGNYDTWVTTRRSISSAWSSPRNLGPTINTSYGDGIASVSADGRWCYFDDFAAHRPGGHGGYDLWQAPIIPIVDFNRDGKVDDKDMALLVADWGKSDSVCDIGPFAWGDGVVDEKDLGVLMESLVVPQPKASDVPCDVVLSWISPSFAQTCDVYLGASHETVNTASRANPQGVLVSQGQTATTYDPAEPLKLSQTYYWRVDFVIAGPTPTIIKGPVLQFTTAALTYPIKSTTATASPSQVNMGPERTIDGSGLDKSDGHSTNGTDMWLSTTAPHWIQYQFDKVYTLHELWVWNSNQPVESFIGFGAKTVKIAYSTDGTTWTALANVPEFARGTGQSGYVHNTTVSFAGVPAKFVKLTIEKAWGSTPSAGLSEVRFFYIPTASAPKP